MRGAAYDPLKRLMDVLVSATALVVLAPVLALVATLVRVKLGSPVLFRQQRPGMGGEIFELIKFRTMRPLDAQRGLITDEDRMTEFGAFLRSTSLDELPTLWNVLRGDMSLVGPRPLLVRYLERHRWWVTLAVAAATAGFNWLVFAHWLRVPFPEGVLWTF